MYDSINILGFHGPVFLFSLLLAPFKQMALSEVYLQRMLHRLLLGGIGIVMDYMSIVLDYIYYYTKKILYFIFFLAMLQGMQDLSFPTGD